MGVIFITRGGNYYNWRKNGYNENPQTDLASASLLQSCQAVVAAEALPDISPLRRQFFKTMPCPGAVVSPRPSRVAYWRTGVSLLAETKSLRVTATSLNRTLFSIVLIIYLRLYSRGSSQSSVRTSDRIIVYISLVFSTLLEKCCSECTGPTGFVITSRQKVLQANM